MLAGGGAALAVAQSPGTSKTTVISACYLNSSKPGQAVLSHIASDGTCPHGYTKISWNAQGPTGPAGPRGPRGTTGKRGPQGPPGVSDGVATGNPAQVDITTANTLYTVLTSPAVPVAGNYYVTASVTLHLDAGALMGCYVPNEQGTAQADTEAAGSPTYATLPVAAVISVPAGGTIQVVCEGSFSPSGYYLSGNLDATLVGNSTFASTARPSGTARTRLPLPPVK